MADGKGCICSAWNSSECTCDADWTPQEIYDLQAQVKDLRAALKMIAKPALGGKLQQQIAQQALKRNEYSETDCPNVDG